MNYASAHKPSKLNLDKAKKCLLPNESSFLLNHDVNNPSALGKATPMAANYPACDLELPAGENYAPNTYYSKLTNESYTWHYNSNNVHFISRINGDGECEIVYNGECLTLSADPKHQITQWRAILDQDFLCNKVPGGALKRLVWTDGTDSNIHCLDVEASIATDFFTTPFFDICPDPCAYLQLCVPEPQGCLVGEFVPFTSSDKSLSNKILDKGFKFAYRDIYYDGRASELSDWSSLYFIDARGCFDNAEGFSRCIKFRIPLGNPMVEKIEFYFSEDGGLTWFLYDTIEKYKKYNSNQQYWYQRDLSEQVSSTFSQVDCSFDYIFCNDKQRIPIDPKLLTRVANPIPREVQGIFRIKDLIAAYNYKVGTCPIDKTEIDKLNVELVCDDASQCETKFAKVIVRAVVYNHQNNENGAVGRANGSNAINTQVPDDLTDPAVFLTPGYINVFGAYDQVFSGETRNFIVYIEGTDYWGQMEQWRSTPNFVSVNKVGTLAGIAPGLHVGDGVTSFNNGYGTDIHNGNFYYQEYTFTVPQGTKGFLRLASHHQTSGSGSNQDTSTQVLGILGDLRDYSGLAELEINTADREIYFDTCSGDVELFNAFIIDELFENDHNTAYNGYITDKNGLPVEGAIVAKGDFYRFTDHNGFYTITDDSGAGNPTNLSIRVEQNCVDSFTQIETFAVQSGIYQNLEFDHEISSQYYADNFTANVSVSAMDCDNVPIRGLRIAMSGSKYRATDVNGIAHFFLRNYVSRSREIVSVVMDKGNCFNLDCNNNCNPCLPSTQSLTLQACFMPSPTYSLTMPITLNTQNSNATKKGLKAGGRYPFGVIVEGDCGQVSAVYPLSKLGGYFDIPTTQQKGTLGFCDFAYNTTSTMILPSWAKRLKFVRGTNVNKYYLQWVVDDIQKTSNGKILITIQSLNDYNSRYNFKTNTVYQYLEGDRIEFIRNGDGNVLDTAAHGILNYLIINPFNDVDLSDVTDNPDYFNQLLINDDGKLDGITKGAIIEMQGATTSQEQLTYNEICASIPLKQVGDHTELSVSSGVFSTFDTYLVSRQIGSFPAQFFESKTPSDFWGGTGLDDLGKVHFVNSYENEKRYPRNISINSATQLNYFGDLVKTLDAEEQGYITAISVVDDKVGLAVCQNDNFLFNISDDLLRLSSSGVIVAAPADSIISNPEPKLVGQYGCLYQDIGSVLFGDGYALWFDGQANTYIIHNYSFAKIAASYIEEGQVRTCCNSYFKKRNRDKENFNKSSNNFLDHYRYSTGINKSNRVVYLTLKSLRHSGINNEQAPYLLPNETIMYHPATDSFLGFASFTPEGYSELSLDTYIGCSFLSYQNSLPYIHMLNPDKWNEFYGVSCDWRIGITLNKFSEKIKIPLALEIQSDKMFFATKVTTDKSTFLSEIPPIKVKQRVEKWNAPLLNDINSRGGLYNGSNARSYFTDILLCRDNTVNLAYNSVNTDKQQEYSEVDQIIIKFELVESSGMSGNL